MVWYVYYELNCLLQFYTSYSENWGGHWDDASADYDFGTDESYSKFTFLQNNIDNENK